MISMEILDQTWSSISPQAGKSIARRADPSHPLDFFVGFNEEERMQLMLIADNDYQLPMSSKQIRVKASQRTDGKYAICFTLQSCSLRDTFISLSWDIINCTYDTRDQRSGIDAAIKRFGIWLIMLAKGKDDGLSKARAKGLLGELLILHDLCIPLYGASKAVNGWIGPLYADRDFEYEDLWIEAKAVSSDAENVSISSFDQLDIDQEGYLILCRLEKTGPTDPNGISIRSTITKLQNAIAEDANASTTLQIRLMLSGYKNDDPQLDEMYILKRIDRYVVTDGFPRIRKSSLPMAVVNGSYSLKLEELAPWEDI